MRESALALIDSIANDKVLFIGDTIIDEYHFCEPLQKAAKEYLIPLRYKSKEVFQGGVDAAAAHLKTFCKTVHVGSQEGVTRKVRFVDAGSLQKLAEVHYSGVHNERPWPKPSQYDVVVVADFGHGEITHDDEEEFEDAPFLAVSAQTNSANRGFNLITKYRAADYIVIDEPEARLAMGMPTKDKIDGTLHWLASACNCSKFVITMGRNGACGYEDGKIYHQPAFTDLVRDTMGAGDAFFAITAPMARTGSMEDLLFIGCAAGALKCSIVGHRSSVTKESLIEFIRSR